MGITQTIHQIRTAAALGFGQKVRIPVWQIACRPRIVAAIRASCSTVHLHLNYFRGYHGGPFNFPADCEIINRNVFRSIAPFYVDNAQ